jgi:outer membrane protein, multidrug efflux system
MNDLMYTTNLRTHRPEAPPPRRGRGWGEGETSRSTTDAGQHAKASRNLIATAVIALLLPGCSLAPQYLRPAMPVSQTWPAGESTKSLPTAQAGKPLWSDVAWKTFFTGPELQGLIQQALDNNRDLRVAALNVEVARASYRSSAADLLPTVKANGDGTRSLTPSSVSQSTPPQASLSREYAANLGVTAFELDFFGRLRNLKESALESYLATDEARTATQISLVAEVANAYLTLLGDRKLLALTDDTLKSRLESLAIIQSSVQHGVGTDLDLAQARTAAETTRANRAKYLRQVDQDRNALALLVGAPVDLERLGGDLDSVPLVEDLPVGVPSQVLLRRPDIMQAEHGLKAANANICAARAAFFPSISLTGSAGYASTSLGNLFQGSSGAWSFGPAVSVPIFDAGRNQANLASAKASRDIAVAQYEKSIQTAFREVSDGLAAKGTLADQTEAQSALVAANQTSYRLARARFEGGVDSYLPVLDSQRSLFSAQQDLVSVRVSRLSNLVTLYKVLGGGSR